MTNLGIELFSQLTNKQLKVKWLEIGQRWPERVPHNVDSRLHLDGRGQGRVCILVLHEHVHTFIRVRVLVQVRLVVVHHGSGGDERMRDL